MVIFFIGLVTLITVLNFAFYEYRVQKPQKDDMQVFETWVQNKLNKKYKC